VLLINEPGLPEIELQDTLKTDSVTKVNTSATGSFANIDSILIKKDTSQIQVPAGISGRIGYSQDTSIIQGESIPQSKINNLTYGEDIPYYLPDTANLSRLNISLENFNEHYFSIKETSELIYKGQSKSSGKPIGYELIQNKDENRSVQHDINPDWLIAIIIGSLVILAWLKLFFNKFIDQVIVSMWNFQLGSKFLRDQGIFSRRIGFVLNINFLLIFGLFIYVVFAHFNINPLSLKPFAAYLLYTGILTILLLIRCILTSLTGKIFNREESFREYLYHILIIYKNMGIVFIPIVFCIAYIQENLRIYFIIFALVLIILAYIFRFIKGFQLIIKKDVIIFYLILYLCTLEIIPVLFYYKFFSGWIY
jgi:hypothetical protein